ncbi:MAG: DUF1573 domain-containing protein [Rikenellaceae bacterium]|jgi:hypothetical protein|nr:DUF1573 domain-containing protein [Rikenellaceae bacterium]
MKIFRNIVVLFFALLLGQTAGLAQDEPSAPFSMDRTAHDFGVIPAGKSTSTTFTLTNTGASPLVLLEARVACNCVKVRWPRRPIAPGASASIEVSYRDNQPGAFYKIIDILTNANPEPIKIRVQGSVTK